MRYKEAKQGGDNWMRRRNTLQRAGNRAQGKHMQGDNIRGKITKGGGVKQERHGREKKDLQIKTQNTKKSKP